MCVWEGKGSSKDEGVRGRISRKGEKKSGGVKGNKSGKGVRETITSVREDRGGDGGKKRG